MKPARTFVGAAVLVAVMAGNAAADFGDPFPGAGTDSFPSDLTHTVQFIANPLGLPVGTFPLTANGPTEVVRGDPYPGGPGSRYQIDTEIVSMNLTGTTPFGPITVRESPWYDSIGLVRELGSSADPGHFPAESFFDVFVEIDLGPLTVFNKDAAYMYNGNVLDLPPTVPPHNPYVLLGWLPEGSPWIGDFVEPAALNPLPLPLYVEGDEGEVHVGYLVQASHAPLPVPGAALLGAIGLGLVGWVRRR